MTYRWSDSPSRNSRKAYATGRVFGHLRFALRYEPLDMRAWNAVVHAFGSQSHARRLADGFVDLADPRLQITGPIVKIRKQRINANLIGDQNYCVLIRRTDQLSPTRQSTTSAKKLARSRKAAIRQCSRAPSITCSPRKQNLRLRSKERRLRRAVPSSLWMPWRLPPLHLDLFLSTPFEDGNARIHRFLVHHVLDQFSSSIMPFVDSELTDEEVKSIEAAVAELCESK